MKNKLKKLIIIVLTLLFIILLLNILSKGIEKNKSDITNNNVRTIIINFFSLLFIFYFYS